MQALTVDMPAFAATAGWLGLFLLGYLMILIVPGANMMIVFAVASTHGLRKAFPIVAAIGSGSATLLVAMSLGAASGVVPDGTVTGLALISGGLVLYAAWRLLQLRPPAAIRGLSSRPPDVAARHGRVGFACSLTNPVTAAYFMPAILMDGNVWLHGSGLAATATLVLVASVAVNLAAAQLLSLRAVQDAAGRLFRPIRIAAAVMVVFLGAHALHPHLEPVRRLVLGWTHVDQASTPAANAAMMGHDRANRPIVPRPGARCAEGCRPCAAQHGAAPGAGVPHHAGRSARAEADRRDG